MHLAERNSCSSPAYMYMRGLLCPLHPKLRKASLLIAVFIFYFFSNITWVSVLGAGYQVVDQGRLKTPLSTQTPTTTIPYINSVSHQTLGTNCNIHTLQHSYRLRHLYTYRTPFDSYVFSYLHTLQVRIDLAEFIIEVPRFTCKERMHSGKTREIKNWGNH